MTTTTKTQTRGVCQCCGNEQAIVRGKMSKHGYTVEQGWFSGVCTGQHFKPLQIERAQADAICVSVRRDAAALRIQAAKLESGEMNPAIVKIHNHLNPETGKRGTIEIPFAQADKYEQDEARRAAVWNTTRRAEMGESFANALEARADKIHGTELRTVEIAPAAAPIRKGETRSAEGSLTLTCEYVDGARVYWKAMRGDKPLKGWTGTQAWRRMNLEAPQA